MGTNSSLVRIIECVELEGTHKGPISYSMVVACAHRLTLQETSVV